MVNASFFAAAGITLANVAEAKLACYLFSRCNPQSSVLHTLKDYLCLLATGALASLLGAVLGASTLLASAYISLDGYVENIAHWWMGDVLGIALFTPFFMLWLGKGARSGLRARFWEAIALIGLSLFAGQVIFLDWFQSYMTDTPRGYWMFLFITWVAMRLGRRGVTLLALLVALQALAGAFLGLGLFRYDLVRAQLHNYWAYMLIVSVVGMVISSYINEIKVLLTDLRGKQSEIEASSEQIRQLAFYDFLTNLPNRRLLMDRMAHALAASARSGKQGALLFIDLDRFKTLNDTLGHDVGDLLLQQVARRLEACVREGDTVARLGGDEFVVMLEQLDEQETEAAAKAEATGEKILFKLNQFYQLLTHEHHTSPSIGIVLFNGHQQSVDELMKQADIAMYQAKKAGRNTLRFFDPKMQDAINLRAGMEAELHRALELGQFQLYYQIQIDSQFKPLGAESLLRWIHPERGMISPLQFIPLAEETGLILPIGHWVLDTACAQIKAWQESALTRELVLAVNVSAKQFRQSGFVDEVREIVLRHGISPSLLKLELTESMLLDNVDEIAGKMKSLKSLGIQFSLDDFGTGYSSLQYLKKLPLDQLKIDQSFIRDISTDLNDKAIVRTIIAMAHSLNLHVIAEGVETEQERGLLLDKGCFHYQGYLFGRPVPIEQFESLLQKM